jgi:hypothetical protein
LNTIDPIKRLVEINLNSKGTRKEVASTTFQVWLMDGMLLAYDKSDKSVGDVDDPFAFYNTGDRFLDQNDSNDELMALLLQQPSIGQDMCIEDLFNYDSPGDCAKVRMIVSTVHCRR